MYKDHLDLFTNEHSSMMMGVFTQSLCLHCKLITLSSRNKVLQYCLDYQLHFPMFVLVNSHINKNP